MNQVIDPVLFAKKCWPDIHLYNRQREVLYSVQNNDETFVPAGNMLGKDFVGGICVLHFFISRHPVRIVTTSVDGDHLDVLWGEIRRFMNSSVIPLTADKGGPIIVNHMHLKKTVNGQIDGLSYVIGRVAAKGEGMQGHHIAKVGDGIPRTLFVGDEVSGMEDTYYTMASTWANRMLFIGNPWPCENFFKRAVKGDPTTKDPGGDRKSKDGDRYYRKIIQIKAVDSPNVRWGMTQAKQGKDSSGMIIPGVKSYDEYLKNRELWDSIRQCVGLDAEFYEGAEVLLFPPEWLNLAERIAANLPPNRKAKAIGVDPAEGGDHTALAAADEKGIIDVRSVKTPDTSVIPGMVLAYAREYGVKSENILFDRGGGGKQHADQLRALGHEVGTVAFGQSLKMPEHTGMTLMTERQELDEERYVYCYKRDELYGELRIKLDPANEGYGIPAHLTELRRQLAPIPLTYDPEGRLRLLPKRNRDPNSKKQTLIDLIGCSPDEADAAVLAVHGIQKRVLKRMAGAAF